MSDEACPYCGEEYDFDAYWRERDFPDSFTIGCDGCGEIFVVNVTMRPEFTAIKRGDEEQDE